MKKKWELLKYAYDNYPKGTIAVWHPNTPTEFECSGIYNLNDRNEVLDSKFNVLFAYGEWVKVVTDQETVSKHFIISEDGETLYDGGKYFHVHQVDGMWQLNKSFEPDYALCLTSTSKVITDPDHNKAFSRYDDALMFIDNQTVIVDPNSSYPIHVTRDSIIVQTKNHEPGENLVFSIDEMQECVSVYKLLNDEKA